MQFVIFIFEFVPTMQIFGGSPKQAYETSGIAKAVEDAGGEMETMSSIKFQQVDIPGGYYLTWSGQYEYIQRAYNRLMVMIPLALFLIFLLLYINTRSFVRTIIVQVSVLFALVGAVWIVYILGYQIAGSIDGSISVCVWN